MAGKGDLPRPVNLARYEANYDNIFRTCRSTAEHKEHEANETGVINCETQASMHVEVSSSPAEQIRQM